MAIEGKQIDGKEYLQDEHFYKLNSCLHRIRLDEEQKMYVARGIWQEYGMGPDDVVTDDGQILRVSRGDEIPQS